MNALRKIDEAVAAVLKYFVTALCVGIALILFVRVIIRFTPLTLSLSWTDEVVEWMMAWMIFTTSSLIMRNGEHFRVDLLETKLKGTVWLKLLNLFITVISIVFFVVLLYYSMDLVIKTNQFSPILKVTTKLPYSSIPANCALILLYEIRNLTVDITKLIKK